ncbi:two-component system sensor histidine kinase UhpB [Bradyrhizobium sp. USDA 4524]|uniref:histidine kinase n=1 Tax=unclassified Bradyrhizobium TaxID=2631580 RepID=UPI0020A052D8|nr:MULTISPECIES: histidine kinase [unclassified Bradyrhizobium]MCP1842927.1 two-component system sensor histidine kinase UhpB [Bradyrhizobium sp. USDA 4538]MCP1903492.1 two-component system sensor histidine kinase UhpB [Bradyrhizobium sp. USDA 4537]MCP1990851.1 two-component system sensor histidine kinase UhpB [Bradyrhizobium sp. USDA 4539]
MWQKLSLRARINLLLALILALGLGINIARLVLEAGPRVQAEDQSVIRLAREFVATIVAGLDEAPDPDARLDQIVQDLSRLRHVSITRQDGATAKSPDRPEDVGDQRAPPQWFVALVHPEQTSVRVPISVHGKPQSLVITSHPDDEVAEIWDGIVTQIEVGSAITVALLLVTMLVVGRALAPLEALSQAMTGIEAGDYDARVEPGGSPELAAICAKLNHLAATLGDAVEGKRQLAERAVSLQDSERKEIARELHDEFGPYLFALRAHAGALTRLAEVEKPDPAALRKHGNAILEQVNALQQFTRRILERLRPVGLAELGLAEALGALVRLWSETHPEVKIESRISPALGDTGEMADLTIYRIVQEALTNVFRHAGATAVDITVEPAECQAGLRGSRDCALVRVRDNGRGLLRDHRLGRGLTGMQERILALGGTLNINSSDDGVTVEALVPKAARS